MPNLGTLVLGPRDIRRFLAECRFAEYRRTQISLLSVARGTARYAPAHVFSRQAPENPVKHAENWLDPE